MKRFLKCLYSNNLMIKILKFAIPLLIIFLLFRNILYDIDKIGNLFLNFNPVLIFLSFVLAGFLYIEGGYCWYLILRKLKVDTTLRQATRIWIISNTGRYIPGMIWQYIGRVELAKKELKVGRRIIILSILLETYFTVVSALIISSLGLLTSIRSFIPFNPIIVITLLLILIITPKTLEFAIRILSNYTKYKLDKFQISMSFEDMIHVFPFFIINFLIGGVLLFVITYSLSEMYIPENTLFIFSLYSISWIGGYLSFFSPGGIGVAEGITAYLLSFYVPLSIASFIALSLRVIVTIMEIVIFLFLLKFKYESK